MSLPTFRPTTLLITATLLSFFTFLSLWSLRPSPQPVAIKAITLASPTLLRTLPTSALSPPAPDPAGITYLPHKKELLVSDSEVNEMPIFQGKNLFSLTPSGSLTNTSSTLAFSHEPTGLSYAPDLDRLFVSDDDQRRIFQLQPGSDQLFGTGDDLVTSFSTSAFGNTDPEGVAYAQTSASRSLYIAGGILGRVYQTTLEGALLSTFDLTVHGASDLEGITFHQERLYVLDTPKRRLLVLTPQGTLLGTISLAAAASTAPADLVFAPSSSLTDSPSTLSLYLVDRGVDNNIDPTENDGKLYELSLDGLPAPPPTGGPTPTPSPAASPRTFTLSPFPSSTPTPPPAGGPTPAASCLSSPDANRDNTINEADYEFWYAFFKNPSPSLTHGDFNCSGKVDGVDYVIWLIRYQERLLPTPPPTGGPTPPPTGGPTPTPPPTGGPTPTPPPTGGPTPPLSHKLKYYGVDRALKSELSFLGGSQHLNTVVARFIVSDQSSWLPYLDAAQAAGIQVVVWPEGGPYKRGNCSWSAPYPANPPGGDYILGVKPMLDKIASHPSFVGIVNAHEPFWTSCPMTISEMAAIKSQLQSYIQAKSGRHVKVWNYVDNLFTNKLPDQDIARIMDVAVTWQHCFGGVEGTCSYTLEQINKDRARLNKAGLTGRVELVFLPQTFAYSYGYQMPSAQDLLTWSCRWLNSGALDGYVWYTWGAKWYHQDLDDRPDLWPVMNQVYSQCLPR